MNLNLKTSRSIKLLSVGLMLLIFTNCKKESDSGSSAPVITLSAEKLAGQGQYAASHEYSRNGAPLSINVSISSPSDIQSFTISKTLNLTADATYAQNGTLTVDPGSLSSGQYTFTYAPTSTDANQLIGFRFTVVSKSGAKSESDLTLSVNLSPAANLPFRKWQLKTIIHVNGETPNEDVTLDCNKDNFYTFNEDGTCVLDNGALSCDIFEPFDTPQTWSLTNDNKTLTIMRLNGFTNEIIPQVFEVKELTLTTLKLELLVDLSGFGGKADERFLYTYAAGPR